MARELTLDEQIQAVLGTPTSSAEASAPPVKAQRVKTEKVSLMTPAAAIEQASLKAREEAQKKAPTTGGQAADLAAARAAKEAAALSRKALNLEGKVVDRPDPLEIEDSWVPKFLRIQEVLSPEETREIDRRIQYGEDPGPLIDEILTTKDMNTGATVETKTGAALRVLGGAVSAPLQVASEGVTEGLQFLPKAVQDYYRAFYEGNAGQMGPAGGLEQLRTAAKAIVPESVRSSAPGTAVSDLTNMVQALAPGVPLPLPRNMTPAKPLPGALVSDIERSDLGPLDRTAEYIRTGRGIGKTSAVNPILDKKAQSLERELILPSFIDPASVNIPYIEDIAARLPTPRQTAALVREVGTEVLTPDALGAAASLSKTAGKAVKLDKALAKLNQAGRSSQVKNLEKLVTDARREIGVAQTERAKLSALPDGDDAKSLDDWIQRGIEANKRVDDVETEWTDKVRRATNDISNPVERAYAEKIVDSVLPENIQRRVSVAVPEVPTATSRAVSAAKKAIGVSPESSSPIVKRLQEAARIESQRVISDIEDAAKSKGLPGVLDLVKGDRRADFWNKFREQLQPSVRLESNPQKLAHIVSQDPDPELIQEFVRIVRAPIQETNPQRAVQFGGFNATVSPSPVDQVALSAVFDVRKEMAADKIKKMRQAVTRLPEIEETYRLGEDGLPRSGTTQEWRDSLDRVSRGIVQTSTDRLVKGLVQDRLGISPGTLLRLETGGPGEFFIWPEARAGLMKELTEEGVIKLAQQVEVLGRSDKSLPSRLFNLAREGQAAIARLAAPQDGLMTLMSNMLARDAKILVSGRPTVQEVDLFRSLGGGVSTMRSQRLASTWGSQLVDAYFKGTNKTQKLMRATMRAVDWTSPFVRLAEKLEQRVQLDTFVTLIRRGVLPKTAVLQAAQATSVGETTDLLQRVAGAASKNSSGFGLMMSPLIMQLASAGAWVDNLTAMIKSPKDSQRILISWKLLQDAIDRQEGGPKVGQTRVPEPPQVDLLPRIIEAAQKIPEGKFGSALKAVGAQSNFFTPEDLNLSEKLGLVVSVLAEAGMSPDMINDHLAMYAEVTPATGDGAETFGEGETLYEIPDRNGQPRMVSVKLTPIGKKRLEQDMKMGLPPVVSNLVSWGLSASVGALGSYIRPFMRYTSLYGSEGSKRAILKALPNIEWGEPVVDAQKDLKAASGR
jgi:DNA-binding Lrp family transcriptional regulator